MIIKGPKGLGSWRTSGDRPNDSIIEDGQNTEKSPGDLRRLAVTQTPVKKHQLTLVSKTLKEYIIIIIIIPNFRNLNKKLMIIISLKVTSRIKE